MRTTHTTRHQRTGPLFGVLLLVVVGVLAFTPIVEPVGAIDPTPSPSAEVTPEPPTPDPTPAPTPDPTPAPAPDPTPAPTPDPTPPSAPDPTPAPTPDPTPPSAPDPTPGPTPDPTPPSAPDPTPGPTATPAPSDVRATLDISTDAPAAGRHRIDPGSVLAVTLHARLDRAASTVGLLVDLPAGWIVLDGGGGAVDAIAGRVTWMLGSLAAGTRISTDLSLRAPARSSAGDPAFDARFEARVEHAGGIAATAAETVRVAPRLVVEHVAFARVDEVSQLPTYLEPGAEIDAVEIYDTFRVRFQVRNADALAATLAPRLEYRPLGAESFADLPSDGPRQGAPFHLGVEWRRAGDGKGTLPGPAVESIPVRDIQQTDTDDAAQRPIPGKRLMGEANPPPLTIPGDSYTEVEFTVRASLDLPFAETFQLRLVDDGRPISGAAVAIVRSGLQTPLELSPGQRNGVRVGPPVDVKPVGIREVDFPLVTPAVVEAGWAESEDRPTYRLAVAVPTGPAAPGAPGAPATSPHTPDTTLVSDTCAACHGTHTARNAGLLSEASPQATLCFACHDGSGSNLDTKAQFTDPAVPPNDPATRSYYRHDAATAPTVPNTHSLATNNEFGGVSNRHSECADCHNSHIATTQAPTQFSDGWSVSGRQASISGVSVVNGPAGTAPTYTFLGGTVGSQPTREYQICLKCHSGFTTLPDTTGQPPSRQALDKAIELNPATSSYHPVQAAGTNSTAAMAGSLSGTSPYKQWNFTTDGTVRCVNCHGDPRKLSATAAPAAGSDLAPHTSQFRGLLIQNYRDRDLKGRYEAYAAADFALCYVCHAEAPFLNSTYAGTNFLDHDKHVSRLANKGSNTSTDIDTPGAGQGNAICSECHYRTHGTALAYNESDRSNARLVNFAPNVTAWEGVLKFVPMGATTNGSCTLTCHGKAHENETY